MHLQLLGSRKGIWARGLGACCASKMNKTKFVFSAIVLSTGDAGIIQ